jgi:hypothetical protein
MIMIKGLFMDYRTKDRPLTIDCLLLARYFHPQADELSHRATFLALALEKHGLKIHICSPEISPRFKQTVVPHKRTDLALESFAAKPFWRWGPRKWAQELSQWPDPDRGWANQVEADLQVSDIIKPRLILVSTPSDSALGAALKLGEIWGCKIVCDIGRSWRESRLRPDREAFFRKGFEKSWFFERLKASALITVPNQAIYDEINHDFGLSSVIWQIDDGLISENDQLLLKPETDLHLGLISSGLKSNAQSDFVTLLHRFERACLHRDDLVLHISGLLSHTERQFLMKSPQAARLVHYGPLDAIMANQLAYSVDYHVIDFDDQELIELKKNSKAKNRSVQKASVVPQSILNLLA